jgi:hypothetical protein
MPPDELVRFNLSDWPSKDGHLAFADWRAARLAFEAVHGWPAGFVEMLQGIMVERRIFVFADPSAIRQGQVRLGQFR